MKALGAREARSIGSTVASAQASVVGGVLAGMLSGGLMGLARGPERLRDGWEQAALGVFSGVACGVLLSPLFVWAASASADPLRRWAAESRRGLSAVAFLMCPLIAACSTVCLVTLSVLLRRIQGPEVAALLSVVVITGCLAAAAVLGAMLVRCWKPAWAPRSSLSDILLKPTLLGLFFTISLGAAIDECQVLLPFGLDVWGPRDVLTATAASIDIRAFATLALACVLSVPMTLIAARRPWLGAAVTPLALSLVAALAADPRAGSIGALPGPSRVTMNALHRLSDADHDGFARLFGGGDCDDSDPAVHPHAVEVAGNHRDEDCAAGDLDPSLFAGIDEPDRSEPAVRAALEAAVPQDLNLILLTVDALRSDLHFAGNPLRVSPNLDHLAARSVVFTHAYATSTYTSRSLGSMMTGRYAGELARTPEVMHRYGRANVFLAERLRASGAMTTLVPCSEAINAETGLAQGFVTTNRDVIPAHRIPGLLVDGRGADRIRETLLWPRADRDRIMVWGHFIDPHEDYVPHPEFGDFGPPPLGHYWQEVAWTDAQIGRVVDAIEAMPEGQRRRTVLIVTADHGESFNEHGAAYHGNDVWEEQVRVPLLVFVPGVHPRRVDTPRSTIDLVPTILDLWRLPRPHLSAPDALSGASLLPDLLGFDAPQRPIYADLPAESAARAPVSMLIDGRWKLRERGGEAPRLYDLATDPREAVDQSASRPRELTHMRSLLGAFRARLDVVVATRQPPLGW
jgi:choline-sulfatase